MVDLDLRVSGCSRRRRPTTRVGCLLLDVVLGHGAHPDPAGELARRGRARRRAARSSSRACAAPTRTRRTRGARRRRSRRPARSSRRRTPRRRGSRCGRSRHDRAPPPLRVAMLTYSVRPRGGVVHAIAVAEALAARGHAVELFAVGPAGRRVLPRARACPADRRPARRRRRTATSTRRSPRRSRPTATACARSSRDGGFDVVHAQDCISANAALALRDEGVDRPRDPHRPPRRRLPLAVAHRVPDPLDRRARPRRCASRRRGSARVRDEFGVEAGLVGNGVDPERYRPARDAAERARRARRRGPERAPRDPHGRRDRAAQGLAHAARGLRRRRATRCPTAARCCSSPAARRCSTTATRSTASTRARRSSALDGDLRVLGPVEDAELEGLYRAADVFALPVDEGGLRARRPRGARRRAARGRVRPRRVPRVPRRRRRARCSRRTGDADALAEALVRVARDPALAERLRAGGPRGRRAPHVGARGRGARARLPRLPRAAR